MGADGRKRHALPRPSASGIYAFIAGDKRPDWVSKVRVVTRDSVILEVQLYTTGLASQGETVKALDQRLGKAKVATAKNWYHKLHGNLRGMSMRWVGPGWEAQYEATVGGNLDQGFASVSVTPAAEKKPAIPL